MGKPHQEARGCDDEAMKGIFSSIAKNSLIIMGSRFVLKALSFVSYYFIITGLSLADYGLATLALSVSGPVIALSGLGQDALIMAQGAQSRGKKEWNIFAPTYGGFAIVRVVITGLLVVLLFWFRELLGGQYRELLDQFFVPLIAWTIIASFRVLFETTLQMEERFGWFAKANILENAARLVIVAMMFFGGWLSVPNILWAYVGAKTVGAVYASPIMFNIPFTRAGIIPMIRAYTGFITTRGKWEVFRMMAGNLFSGINQWVVGILLGLEAVAILSFASTMNSLLTQALPFRQILFPIMARLSSEGTTSSFVARRMSKYSVWLNTLIILLAGIAAPVAVGIVVSQYLASVPIFWLLSFSQILNGVSTSQGTLLYAYGEQKYLFKISLLGTISSLTVLPLFTWLFHLYGTVLEQHLHTGMIILFRERRLRKRHYVSTFRFKDVLTFDAFDRKAIHRLWFAVSGKIRTRLNPS